MLKFGLFLVSIFASLVICCHQVSYQRAAGSPKYHNAPGSPLQSTRLAVRSASYAKTGILRSRGNTPSLLGAAHKKEAFKKHDPVLRKQAVELRFKSHRRQTVNEVAFKAGRKEQQGEPGKTRHLEAKECSSSRAHLRKSHIV